MNSILATLKYRKAIKNTLSVSGARVGFQKVTPISGEITYKFANGTSYTKIISREDLPNVTIARTTYRPIEIIGSVVVHLEHNQGEYLIDERNKFTFTLYRRNCK